MNALFSPDSRFMRTMSRIADLVLLNLCYLLTCLPAFTIGAASAALYTVCFRFGSEEESGVIRSYFRTTALINAWIFYAMPGGLRFLSVLFAILFVLAVIVFGYAFPLLSQFDDGVWPTLRNSLILGLGYLPRSLLITAFNIFPFALMLADFYLFLQAAFLWTALYFSLAAYVNTFLLKRVLAPYLTGGDLEEE